MKASWIVPAVCIVVGVDLVLQSFGILLHFSGAVGVPLIVTGFVIALDREI